MSIINYTEDKTLTIKYSVKDDDANKNWHAEIDVCPHPTCACQEITILIYDTKKEEAKLPKHYLSLDVFEKKAVKLEGKRPTSKEDFKLSKSFANNFSEKDWRQLQQFFLDYKRMMEESTPIDQLDVFFPEKRIEKESLMIRYSDIFPHAEKIWFEINDIIYLVEDQYCLASTCSCTHSALTFIAIKNKKKIKSRGEPLTFLFDYKKKSYEILDKGPKNIATPRELVNEILQKNLGKLFKNRHKKLRSLYRNFRKKHQQSVKQSSNKPLITTETNEQKKIGRNDPCPCGSGKKYKKCCLSKQ